MACTFFGGLVVVNELFAIDLVNGNVGGLFVLRSGGLGLGFGEAIAHDQDVSSHPCRGERVLIGDDRRGVGDFVGEYQDGYVIV